MPEQRQIIRIGTRDSQLAHLQTDIVVGALTSQHPDLQFEIIAVKTGGDKILNKPIADIGIQGAFTKELEEALLAQQVDFVVHSLKDLPTDLPANLKLAAVLDREDPRDVLVSHNKTPFLKLKPGARVATSSRRRTAQLRAMRNDLVFVDIRGNIQTRLRKHNEGHCDAMVLAAAGLMRLKLEDSITEFFDSSLCTPAAGQGILAVECRDNDQKILTLLSAIEDPIVRAQADAERAYLSRLGGGCSIPIGALAKIEKSNILENSSENGKQLYLTGCIAALDGSEVFRSSISGQLKDAQLLGQNLAEEMLKTKAKDILESLKQLASNIVSPP